MSQSTMIIKIAHEFNCPRNDLSYEQFWADAFGYFCRQKREELQGLIKEHLEPYGATTSAGLNELITQGRIEEYPALETVIISENLEGIIALIDNDEFTLDYAATFCKVSRGEVIKASLMLFMEARLAQCNERIKEMLAKYNEEDIGSFEISVVEGRHGDHPAWEDLIWVENMTEDKDDIQKLIDVMRGTDPEDCE